MYLFDAQWMNITSWRICKKETTDFILMSIIRRLLSRECNRVVFCIDTWYYFLDCCKLDSDVIYFTNVDSYWFSKDQFRSGYFYSCCYCS
jgi:hypothetical protein